MATGTPMDLDIWKLINMPTVVAYYATCIVTITLEESAVRHSKNVVNVKG